MSSTRSVIAIANTPSLKASRRRVLRRRRDSGVDSLSVILAAFFAAWAIGQYRLEHQIGYAAAAVLALASGGVLAIYGTRFQRKTRNL